MLVSRACVLLCFCVLSNTVMVFSLMVMMRGGVVVSGGCVMMLLRRMFRCLCHVILLSSDQISQTACALNR